MSAYLTPILKKIWMTFFLYFFIGNVHSLEVTGSHNEYNLSASISYLITKDGQFKPDLSGADTHKNLFNQAPPSGEELNLGFIDGSAWIRVSLSRAPGAGSDWVLEIPYLGLDKVDLYQEKKISTLKNGSSVPISQRPYFSRYYAFPIKLSDTPTTYFINVSSDYPITIPLKLIEQNTYYEYQFTENLLQALYYGGLLSLLFYNLVLFLVIKDKRYLLYTFFAATTGLGIFSGNGYGRIYLWPDSASWDQIAQSVLLSIGASLALHFTMYFFRAKKKYPVVNKFVHLGANIYLLLAGSLILSIYIQLPTSQIYYGIFLLTLLSPCLALYVSVKNAIDGVQAATYFMFGWGALCIGAITAALRIFDLVPNNIFTLYALQISSAIEMLLFSFALAHRFQSEQKEKGVIQEALLKSKEETVQALRLSEERLELAVNNRTEKLQQLLISEQRMREQYVRFGAMIAHEFRNPLNIIQAQTTMLEIDSSANPGKVLTRTSVIHSAITRLARLFDQWLESDRLSHAGNQINVQRISVSNWLGSLIESYRAYYSDHLLIGAHLDEPVEILGDDHLIQLAVLNLIENACKYSQTDSKIRIGISRDDYGVGIYVQDSGCGIPADMQESILEPYVRVENGSQTKGVGLGLAFVKRIMEAHDGRIQIQSIPNSGTTITLWFPEHAD